MSLRAISYRGEDTAQNHVTLDLGEPDLHLVKPAGIGRSVVDSHRGVRRKKFKNFLSLVRTQVIGNDVDLALGGLTVDDLCKEIHELDTGVTRAGFSQHLSGLSVQSAVERKGSMPVVLKTMPLGAAGFQFLALRRNQYNLT